MIFVIYAQYGSNEHNLLIFFYIVNFYINSELLSDYVCYTKWSLIWMCNLCVINGLYCTYIVTELCCVTKWIVKSCDRWWSPCIDIDQMP